MSGTWIQPYTILQPSRKGDSSFLRRELLQLQQNDSKSCIQKGAGCRDLLSDNR